MNLLSYTLLAQNIDGYYHDNAPCRTKDDAECVVELITQEPKPSIIVISEFFDGRYYYSLQNSDEYEDQDREFPRTLLKLLQDKQYVLYPPNLIHGKLKRGVIIAVDEKLKVDFDKEKNCFPEFEDYDVNLLEVRIKESSTTVLGVYAPADGAKRERFLEYLVDAVLPTYIDSEKVIIAGDFNSRFESGKESPKATKQMKSLLAKGFIDVMKECDKPEPTQKTGGTETRLDYVFASNALWETLKSKEASFINKEYDNTISNHKGLLFDFTLQI
jgi:exonuclease III